MIEITADDDQTKVWLEGLSDEQRLALDQMIAVGQRELDDGLGVELDIDDIIARGRARRAAEARAAAE